MTETQKTDGLPELRPLPYHEGMRNYLKAEEPELWDWYASNTVRTDQADSVRFDLLKSTYRIEREAQSELYAAAAEVTEKLSLDVPVTIYQAQNPTGLNASLAYLPNEAHIVLHGPITSKLTNLELRALLAHELSHLLLWRDWDGDYLIVDQILSAMTLDVRAETPHFASARLFQLYTEIFCDRGSLFVIEDPLDIVSMFVKIQTELDEVSAESYIRQADEIFSRGTPKTDQLTHPEAFIRARAIKMWAEGDSATNTKIANMIEGEPALDELDLLGQQKVAALTRRLLDVLLGPKWMQTEPIVAHTRLFFDSYSVPVGQVDDPTLAHDMKSLSESREDEARPPEDRSRNSKSDDWPMADYYCYILLDFVTADRDLEELPLAASLALSEALGFKDRFSEIAQKELRLRKRQFEKIDNQKNNLLAEAASRVPTP